MASAKITINGEQMTIQAPYDRSGHMGRYYKMIGARWNPEQKTWTASATADIFDASRVYRGKALDVIVKALEQWVGDVEIIRPEPEPPTSIKASEVQSCVGQSPEAEDSASIPEPSLETALESFIASPDFKAGVISSTKAGFGGSECKVELFEDGTYRVLWANQIGNRYETPGEILALPQIPDEDLEEIEGWTEEEVQDQAFNLHADEYEQDLRRELDFILEQREEAAKQNWGGKRGGAGRPAQGDEVRVIRVRREVHLFYSRYGGDTKMARVVNGKCIRAWVNAQTYGDVSTVDGRPWWWEGKTLEELKEAGFTHAGNEVCYFGVKTGKEYHQIDDGSWERMDDEGPTPVRGKVEVVEA